jgi:hypothetical protein
VEGMPVTPVGDWASSHWGPLGDSERAAESAHLIGGLPALFIQLLSVPRVLDSLVHGLIILAEKALSQSHRRFL